MPETAKPSTNQNRRYLLLLGWLTFILPGTLFGEQQDPCDECDISLVNGIYENRVERGDRSATSDLASYLCHLSYGDFKKLIAKSGRAGAEMPTKQNSIRRKANCKRDCRLQTIRLLASSYWNGTRIWVYGRGGVNAGLVAIEKEQIVG